MPRLATDRIQDEWDIMAASPVLAGGAVWMFQDRGCCAPREYRMDRVQASNYVWLIPAIITTTKPGRCVDGIVYSNRTPQVDTGRCGSLLARLGGGDPRSGETGTQPVTLHVENRFDFRSLTGYEARWTCRKTARVAPPARCRCREGAAGRGRDVPVTLPPEPQAACGRSRCVASMKAALRSTTHGASKSPARRICSPVARRPWRRPD